MRSGCCWTPRSRAWTLNSWTMMVSVAVYRRERQRRRVSSHCFSGPGHGTRFVINDTRNDGRMLPVPLRFFPLLPAPSRRPFLRSRTFLCTIRRSGGILSAGRICRTRTRVSVACWFQHRCHVGYYQAIMKGSPSRSDYSRTQCV